MPIVGVSWRSLSSTGCNKDDRQAIIFIRNKRPSTQPCYCRIFPHLEAEYFFGVIRNTMMSHIAVKANVTARRQASTPSTQAWLSKHKCTTDIRSHRHQLAHEPFQLKRYKCNCNIVNTLRTKPYQAACIFSAAEGESTKRAPIQAFDGRESVAFCARSPNANSILVRHKFTSADTQHC